MINSYELDAEDEKIINELNDLYGVIQNKEVLRDMIRYIKLKQNNELDFGNYNIIIRNRSSYNFLDDLIKVCTKVFMKYNIIENDKICYLDKFVCDKNNFPLNQIMNISDSIIVINDKRLKIDYSDEFDNLNRIINQSKNKVFIIVSINKQILKINREFYTNVKETKRNERVNKKKKRSNVKEELNELIGLDDVKKQINKILNYVKLNKERGQMPSLHMCFTGNPGTGKTSIARIIGKIFDEENILNGNGEFVEIHGRDLIDKYVGWTAQKVHETVEKAIGGVLFIDEAYSLVSDRRGSFEDEAIATLIKEMEDHRDEICIILAGYTDEMENLLNLNPGFESRIQFTIDFQDYNEDELLEIFKRLCKKEKYKLSSNCIELLIDNFNKAKKEENFGNGRYVRNLFEKVKFEQADRIIQTQSKNINVILKKDVENAIKVNHFKEKEVRKIGFCR